MRPDKISVIQLFSDRSQYLIPLFQRGYVWKLADQIQPLWEDLVDRTEALAQFKRDIQKVGNAAKLRPVRKHFLGTIVTGSLKGGGGDAVASRDVIDGQQRITTFQILLYALRDVVKPLKDEALEFDLKQLTYNVGKYSNKRDHLKVMPTNVGREIMRTLAESGSLKAVCTRFPARSEDGQRIERPLMVQAYLFFYAILAGHLRGVRYDDVEFEGASSEKTIARAITRSIGRDTEVWIPSAENVPQVEVAHLLLEAMRDCLQIMSLELEDDDDPQIVFETLNARGAPLQPSDLIRNFVFLQAARKTEDVDTLYDEYWKAFDEKEADGGHKGEKFWRVDERQGRLKNTRLDLMLYHYVGLRKREELKVAHVFEEFKEWWDRSGEETATELKRIKHLARHFEMFVAPSQANRFGLFCRRMKLLDTSTLTPLVLYFLEHYEPNSNEFVQIIEDLESYVVRRYVCGLTAKGYNRIFLTRLLAEIAERNEKSAMSLRERLLALTGESQVWPDDALFEERWCHRALYQGSNTSKVKAILEALELAQRSSKQEKLALPDDLSVEHVMPQKWQEHWPLQEDTIAARAKRNGLVHSLGNLTLVTPQFNSSLSNAPFSTKRREIITTSLLMLNTHFQQFDDDSAWTEADIVERAQTLFPLAKLIWRRP